MPGYDNPDRHDDFSTSAASYGAAAGAGKGAIETSQQEQDFYKNHGAGN
jgi:hypothetical protein